MHGSHTLFPVELGGGNVKGTVRIGTVRLPRAHAFPGPIYAWEFGLLAVAGGLSNLFPCSSTSPSPRLLANSRTSHQGLRQDRGGRAAAPQDLPASAGCAADRGAGKPDMAGADLYNVGLICLLLT